MVIFEMLYPFGNIFMFVSVFLGSGDLDGLPKVIIIFLTFFFFFLYLGHNKNLSVKEYFIVLQESVLKLGNIFALPVPSP